MTNTQLYLAIGVPVVLNTVVLVSVFMLLSARISDLQGQFNTRFDALNQRLDDMKDMWRAELRRVEEVLDARLKHLEDHKS